jgi:hypothetical protein
MARETYTTSEIPVFTTPQITQHTKVSCDRCGIACGDQYAPDSNFNEIIVGIDTDECVGAYHRRDYCYDCAKTMWDMLCAVLGVDPEQMARTGGY